MASHVQQIANGKGLTIPRDMLNRVGVGDAAEVSEEPGRIVITAPEQNTHDRVIGLLNKWQQEYGLPPRPDGEMHTPVAELMARWDAEDALLSPEEIEAEQRLWEDIERDSHPIEI